MYNIIGNWFQTKRINVYMSRTNDAKQAMVRLKNIIPDIIYDKSMVRRVNTAMGLISSIGEQLQEYNNR